MNTEDAKAIMEEYLKRKPFCLIHYKGKKYIVNHSIGLPVGGEGKDGYTISEVIGVFTEEGEIWK